MGAEDVGDLQGGVRHDRLRRLDLFQRIDPIKRIRRVLRRHRLAFAVSATVLVATAAGTSVTVMQARRTAEAAERARLVRAFVVDLFKAGTQEPPGGDAVRTISSNFLLERGAGLIDTRFRHQPNLRAELYGETAQVFANMGASALAVRYAQKHVEALDLIDASAADRARATIILVQGLLDEGKLQDAQRHAAAAIALAKDHPELLATAKVLRAHVMLSRGFLAAQPDIVP